MSKQTKKTFKPREIREVYSRIVITRTITLPINVVAGQELQRAAMAGELTAQSQQALQAARAQLAQGIESRGGVGVAQAQAQIEALRQNLLQNQYNLGLQVSQIGDNIALGAIRTGMQLDQQLAQANQAFYTQLAAIAGGGTYGYQTPTRTTGTP